MSLDLHPTLKHTRSQAILDRIEAETGTPRIRLYGGTRPAPGGAVTDQPLLAEWSLDDPAGSVTAAVLTLAPVEVSTMVEISGTGTWGRIVDGAGGWVVDGDAGDDEQTAPLLLLDQADLLAGGLVALIAATIGEA